MDKSYCFVFLGKGPTSEARQSGMIYIYINAVLSAVGAIFGSIAIVGFTCLMKRKFNNTRYKHNISIIYYIFITCFVLNTWVFFLFSLTPFILNEVYLEIWQLLLVSALKHIAKLQFRILLMQVACGYNTCIIFIIPIFRFYKGVI